MVIDDSFGQANISRAYLAADLAFLSLDERGKEVKGGWISLSIYPTRGESTSLSKYSVQ